MTKIALNAPFIEGFVKSCMAKGLDGEQASELFQQHALNQLQSLPAVRQAMERVLNAYEGPLTKRAFAQTMQPEKLARVMLFTIHEGDSFGAAELRRMLPEHQALTEQFKKLAFKKSGGTKRAAYTHNLQEPGVADTMSRFERLPLSDKIVLLSSLGGVAGGAENALDERPGDAMHDRSMLGRGLRGAARGAIVGGGAALGAQVGGDLMRDAHGSQQGRMIGQLLGGGGGAFLGGRLASRVMGQ